MQRWVDDVLPGGRVVKAFNTMRAEDLATRGRTDLPVEQRHALFLASDDTEAKAVVARLNRGDVAVITFARSATDRRGVTRATREAP